MQQSSTCLSGKLFLLAHILYSYNETTSSLNPFTTKFKKYVLPTSFKKKCISEVVRIGSMIIFQLSMLLKARFSYCVTYNIIQCISGEEITLVSERINNKPLLLYCQYFMELHSTSVYGLEHLPCGVIILQMKCDPKKLTSQLSKLYIQSLTPRSMNQVGT